MAQKLHHHLIIGRIVFSPKDSEEVACLDLNAVISHDKPTIPVALLGKTQQTLQLQFFNRMKNPELEVRDVIILGLSYLGEMTAEEFQAPPDGMTMQEKSAVDQVFSGKEGNEHFH